MNKLLVASLLVLAPVAIAFGPRRNDPIAEAKTWTVIVTNEGFGGSGRGTGVLLDETHVLTCLHMLETPKDEMFVYTYPLGAVIRAKLEAMDQSNDLAILVLASSAPVTRFPLFQDEYTEGEPIIVVGNALGGMKWFVTRGVISGTDRGSLLTDALINPGNSGGPWVNEKGEIVALTDWRIGPSEQGHYPGLSGGVSSATIIAFIQSYQLKMFLAKMMEGLQ